MSKPTHQGVSTFNALIYGTIPMSSTIIFASTFHANFIRIILNISMYQFFCSQNVPINCTRVLREYSCIFMHFPSVILLTNKKNYWLWVLSGKKKLSKFAKNTKTSKNLTLPSRMYCQCLPYLINFENEHKGIKCQFWGPDSLTHWRTLILYGAELWWELTVF